MPYGGDPVKVLGPDLLKACAALALAGVALLVFLGVVIGKVL